MHMGSRLQPFAFEDRLPAACDCCNDLTLTDRFFSAAGLEQFRPNLRLHFVNERLPPLWPFVDDPDTFQAAGSIHREKLCFRLPSCSKQRGIRRIGSRKDTGSEPRCGAGSFLAQSIGLNHGEQFCRLCGVEIKKELRLACGYGVGLITEVAGNGACHDMESDAG